MGCREAVTWDTALEDGRGTAPARRRRHGRPAPAMNRLADANSPYLLQHAGNPVDWWPWSDAAFQEAQRRNVPVFLSIGYATCHWCHVMEHESFEDEETARAINAAFVPVKVDREERPDVDGVYMAAVLAATGRGGWPLTALVTPDTREPFWVGHLPASREPGRPDRRARAGRQRVPPLGRELRRRPQIGRRADEGTPRHGPGRARRCSRHVRPRGRRTRPRAPLRHGARRLWTVTQVSDAAPLAVPAASRRPRPETRPRGRWPSRRCEPSGGAACTTTSVAGCTATRRTACGCCPHFEKMLYDQALYAHACTEAWHATGADDLRAAAESTLDYVAPRPALTHRRVLLGRGRRLAQRARRARGGCLLRLDARRPRCRSRTRRRRLAQPRSGAPPTRAR